MDRLTVASVASGAGKTSVIVGLAKAAKEKVGYMKPFGNRLLYRKKRLWDYDASLMYNLLEMGDDPESVTLAFDHSKVRYMYDCESIRSSIVSMAKNQIAKKLLIEGGSTLEYGTSVHMDSLSIASYLNSPLLLVLPGDEDWALDAACYFKKRIDTKGVTLAGVVINKAAEPENFTETHKGAFDEMGVNLLGVLPRIPILEKITIDYLADVLFAKVLTGEPGLSNRVESVFVGAMSAERAMKDPNWGKPGKLIITGGDRSDLISAALDSHVSAIVATNNIEPSPAVLSKAHDQNIPVLLVALDTLKAALQISQIEPQISKDDHEKIDAIAKAVRENIAIDELI
ncbi:MAG TPA: phosphotransacetylase family protein [Euryarchaeota archaeon]|nr:phosphotransacetylase family protein [Euryarchaeota archaeon]